MNKQNAKQSRGKSQVAPVKRRRNRRRQRVTSVMQSGHACEKEYYESLNNPWSGPSACLPIWPSRPSQRFRSFARGTISANEAGYTFLVVNPWAMSTSSSGAANSTSLAILTADISTSTTNFDFTAGTDTAFPTGVYGVAHNSPFSVPTLGKLQYRLVSAGIRVKYTGALLNRGGRFVTYRSPGDQNVAYSGGTSLGIMSFSGLSTIREASWGAVGGDWFDVVYTPQERDSLDYIDATQILYGDGNATKSPITNLYSGFAQACMVVMINVSTDAGGGPFEFEVSANFEAVGGLATSLTPSDAPATSNPFKASRLVEEQANHSTLFGDLWGGVKDYIRGADPETIRFATQVGVGLLANRARQQGRLVYRDEL